MGQEDIVAKIGLDATPFSRALRGISGQLNDFRKEVGSNFTGKLKEFGGIFTFFGALEGFKKIGEMTDEIERTSDALDVSTDFLQAFQFGASQAGSSAEDATKGIEKLSMTLGEAASGSDEAQKKFQKYGIVIADNQGRLKSTEEIVKLIADRMRDSTFGAERAEMAMDLFGKSGIKLVKTLQDGSEAIDEMKKKAPIFTREDIENINQVKDGIEELNKGFAVFTGHSAGYVAQAAKIWGAVSVVVGQKGLGKSLMMDWRGWVDTIQQGINLLDQSPALNPKEGQTVKAAKQEKQKIEELTQALHKLRRQSDLDRPEADAQKELLRLETQRAVIQKRIAEQDDPREAIRLNKELQAVIGKIIDTQSIALTQKKLMLNRQVGDLKEQLAFESIFGDGSESLKREKELTEEIEQKSRQILDVDKERSRLKKEAVDGAAQEVKAERELATAKAERSKLTLQELANSPYRFRGRLGDEQRTARRIQFLESLAERNRLAGYLDTSELLRNRADELRAGLTNVVSQDRFPFKAMQENLAAATGALGRLEKLATGLGLIVQAKSGK